MVAIKHLRELPGPVWISLLHIVLFDFVKLIVDPLRLTLPDYDCGFYYIWDLTGAYGKMNGLAPELHEALAAQLGSCLICTVGGVLLSVTALADIPLPKTGNLLISKMRVTDEVKEVTTQIQDSNLLLLFPIYMCVGFLDTFCYTIFVQAFIYCSFGANNIYYVTMVIALCSLVSCSLIGWASKHVSRPKLCMPMYLVILLVLVLLMVVQELPEAVHYLLAAILGITTVALHLQVHALTSQEFSHNLEVSHALLCLGQAVAYLLTFALIRYHGDNTTVMGVVLGSCFIAALCHVIFELRIRATRRSERTSATSGGGGYVLLEEPQTWLPTMDPKRVGRNSKQLALRIPEVGGRVKRKRGQRQERAA